MSEWTGIRQNPVIREWSSNPEADEEFERARQHRITCEQARVAELAKADEVLDQVSGLPPITSRVRITSPAALRAPERLFGRPAPDDLPMLREHASGAHRRAAVDSCRACQHFGRVKT